MEMFLLHLLLPGRERHPPRGEFRGDLLLYSEFRVLQRARHRFVNGQQCQKL